MSKFESEMQLELMTIEILSDCIILLLDKTVDKKVIDSNIKTKIMSLSCPKELYDEQVEALRVNFRKKKNRLVD